MLGPGLGLWCRAMWAHSEDNQSPLGTSTLRRQLEAWELLLGAAAWSRGVLCLSGRTRGCCNARSVPHSCTCCAGQRLGGREDPVARVRSGQRLLRNLRDPYAASRRFGERVGRWRENEVNDCPRTPTVHCLPRRMWARSRPPHCLPRSRRSCNSCWRPMGEHRQCRAMQPVLLC